MVPLGVGAAAVGRKPAFKRADDPAGQRLIQSERIADGERQLPNLQVGRRSKGGRRWQLLDVLKLDDGEVIIRSNADDIGLDRFSRCQPDRDLSGALHHAHQIIDQLLQRSFLRNQVFIIDFHSFNRPIRQPGEKASPAWD